MFGETPVGHGDGEMAGTREDAWLTGTLWATNHLTYPAVSDWHELWGMGHRGDGSSTLIKVPMSEVLGTPGRY